ncbi:hypothetical protein GF391_00745 [Candidatus Uhrbacteria bacterium]|nr:hypothetical protein [Candidatus Uhrbacteria bacterium]
MQMQMSFGQAQRLEQRIKQELKQEMRQELRLALEQVLKLVQALLQKQTLSFEQIRVCWRGVMNVPLADWGSFCRTLRQEDGGHQAAVGLARAMRFVARKDWDLAHLKCMADDLDRVRRRKKNVHRRAVHQDRSESVFGMHMAMQLVLRNPNFFGGGGNHPHDLNQLLMTIPQTTRSGKVRWALTGGWAVELLTGRKRNHHDIDTLVMCKTPMHMDTDKVVPEEYFDVLSCESKFVRKNCLTEVIWKYGVHVHLVRVTRPEFLFCSKFVRAPRPQDWMDVQTLVNSFASSWDLELIRDIARRNCCGFEAMDALTNALKLPKPNAIIGALGDFYRIAA